MKKILALTLASVMMVSSSLCVFAADTTTSSSGQHLSPNTQALVDSINDLKNEIGSMKDDMNSGIADLTEAVKAKQPIIINVGGGGSPSGGGGSSSGGGGSSSTPASSGGNYVNFGGTMTYQGGKIEINGGKSNATFTIKAPSSSVVSSASSLANKVGGSLVSCVNTSSPGVAFSTAKVNFFVGGVQAGDNIAAYQNQGGSWVQLPVVEIRKDHVVVNMTRHGDIAFVRVPVLASIG